MYGSQAGQAIGLGTAAPQPVAATFNDRLNRLAETLHFQCERIEAVLARVNGTPQGKEQRGGDVAQIRPVHALAQIVESLEGTSQRLADLAGGVERIA